MNLADHEASSHQLDAPANDRPSLADVIGNDSRVDPNVRVCNKAWVFHDYDQWAACPDCGGRS